MRELPLPHSCTHCESVCPGCRDGMRQEALHQAPGLRVAWDWQLEGWGYVPGQQPLREEQLVWVVPPGENRWLLTVDRFVLEHAEDIRRGLVDWARTRATSDVPGEVQP